MSTLFWCGWNGKREKPVATWDFEGLWATHVDCTPATEDLWPCAFSLRFVLS